MIRLIRKKDPSKKPPKKTSQERAKVRPRADQPIERPKLVFLLAALGSALIVLLTVFGQGGLVELYGLRKKLQAMNEEIASYELKNKNLRRFIYNLKHDPLTIERIARQELGLVRPGEIVYEFVDERSPGERPFWEELR